MTVWGILSASLIGAAYRLPLWMLLCAPLIQLKAFAYANFGPSPAPDAYLAVTYSANAVVDQGRSLPEGCTDHGDGLTCDLGVVDNDSLSLLELDFVRTCEPHGLSENYISVGGSSFQTQHTNSRRPTTIPSTRFSQAFSTADRTARHSQVLDLA